MLASIGSVGDAYDNAMAESFVDSFKTELIADRVWRTRSQLELAIVDYVGWFNHQRLHSSLGDVPRPSTKRSTSSARRLRATGSRRRPINQSRKPINTASAKPRAAQTSSTVPEKWAPDEPNPSAQPGDSPA